MVSMQHHPNVTAHVHFCVGKGTTSAKIIYGNKQNNKKTNKYMLTIAVTARSNMFHMFQNLQKSSSHFIRTSKVKMASMHRFVYC